MGRACKRNRRGEAALSCRSHTETGDDVWADELFRASGRRVSPATKAAGPTVLLLLRLLLMLLALALQSPVSHSLICTRRLRLRHRKVPPDPSLYSWLSYVRVEGLDLVLRV